LFKILKRIFFIISLIACYFSYTGKISWWWVVALIATTAVFRYLATQNKATPLVAEAPHSSKDETDGPSEFKLEVFREDVMQFGQAMMEIDYLNKIHDVSNLPLEKEKILKAFVTLYQAASNDEKRNRFKLGLMALSRFQDDIGKEPIEIAHNPITHAIAEDEYRKYCLELDVQE
jgi:hypothetical protein